MSLTAENAVEGGAQHVSKVSIVNNIAVQTFIVSSALKM